MCNFGDLIRREKFYEAASDLDGRIIPQERELQLVLLLLLKFLLHTFKCCSLLWLIDTPTYNQEELRGVKESVCVSLAPSVGDRAG